MSQAARCRQAQVTDMKRFRPPSRLPIRRIQMAYRGNPVKPQGFADYGPSDGTNERRSGSGIASLPARRLPAQIAQQESSVCAAATTVTWCWCGARSTAEFCSARQRERVIKFRRIKTLPRAFANPRAHGSLPPRDPNPSTSYPRGNVQRACWVASAPRTFPVRIGSR